MTTRTTLTRSKDVAMRAVIRCAWQYVVDRPLVSTARARARRNRAQTARFRLELLLGSVAVRDAQRVETFCFSKYRHWRPSTCRLHRQPGGGENTAAGCDWFLAETTAMLDVLHECPCRQDRRHP
jgi:hypothetical protein